MGMFQENIFIAIVFIENIFLLKGDTWAKEMGQI